MPRPIATKRRLRAMKGTATIAVLAAVVVVAVVVLDVAIDPKSHSAHPARW